VLTGVQVGFTECFSGYSGALVLISTLTLWTGDGYLDGAGLEVAPYPPAGVVQLADCEGNIRTVPGAGANIVDPVARDEQTWGAVKSLYGR
jgi:hypothetical protein